MVQQFSTTSDYSQQLRVLLLNFIETENFTPDLISVSSSLLSSGADPNQNVGRKTKDTLFLKVLFYLPHPSNFLQDESNKQEKIRELLLTKNGLLILMLRAGADFRISFKKMQSWESEIERMIHGQLFSVVQILRRHIVAIKNLLDEERIFRQKLIEQ
jgi:hypothetical protein